MLVLVSKVEGVTRTAPSAGLCSKYCWAIPEDSPLWWSPGLQIYLRLGLYKFPELMNPSWAYFSKLQMELLNYMDDFLCEKW